MLLILWYRWLIKELTWEGSFEIDAFDVRAGLGQAGGRQPWLQRSEGNGIWDPERKKQGKEQNNSPGLQESQLWLSLGICLNGTSREQLQWTGVQELFIFRDISKLKTGASAWPRGREESRDVVLTLARLFQHFWVYTLKFTSMIETAEKKWSRWQSLWSCLTLYEDISVICHLSTVTDICTNASTVLYVSSVRNLGNIHLSLAYLFRNALAYQVLQVTPGVCVCLFVCFIVFLVGNRYYSMILEQKKQWISVVWENFRKTWREQKH